MKKYFFFAAAAIVAASCAKTPAPVQTPDGPEAPAVEGKVAVQFGTNVVSNVETKAPITAWASQDLYILGFPRKSVTQAEGASTAAINYETAFINNVKATAPTSGTSGTITNLYSNASESIPFYYEGTKTYDFFGYYVGNAANPIIPTITEAKDGYTLPIKIDGTQDIMVAKADHSYACDIAFGDPTPGNGENNREASKVPTGWKDDYAFSAYAARRGVHPYLQFEHLLTQLSFKVTSGTDFKTGDSDPDGSPALKVTKIEILNATADSTLCVAGSAIGLVPGTEGEEAYIALAVKDTDNADLTPVLVPSKEEITDPDPAAVNVGQPIMLYPRDEFKIKLTVEQESPASIAYIERTITHSDYVGDATPNTITDGKTLFAAGYSYEITFKLYGLEDVEITAVLAPWTSGGTISIDTDDAPTIY